MSVGLVSDDELEKELTRLSPKVHPVIESHIEHTQVIDVATRIESPNTRGRSVGDLNVPESLRAIIGEESVINGRESALQIAKDFGVSPSSVSAYNKGATSTKTYDSPNKSLINHINKSRERHIKKASHVLNSALSAISQEKLDYADVKDLSGIAKDMSVIIKNLEPQKEPQSEGQSSPQFIIYAPSFRSENSFESITVNE